MMFRLLEDLLGKSKFYSFETMILDSVISRIEAENGLRLNQQIEVINYIQRHREGRKSIYIKCGMERSYLIIICAFRILRMKRC